MILTFTTVKSQNPFDLQFPEVDRPQKCSSCLQAFNEKPKEVGFSIQEDTDGSLYFEINHEGWFTKLFKNEGAGIAIDVVLKDRYDCGLTEIVKKKIKGKLLPPVYSPSLRKNVFLHKKNTYRVKVGELPLAYRNKDVEFNILFLNNRYVCQYYRIFDLDSYKWDLLDMGLFLDSLTYKGVWNDPDAIPEVIPQKKFLEFIVPFEKDKSQYRIEDIKPMYDSLRLTNFTIEKIGIQAYASVEGNLKRNVLLQQERAQSIVDALQEFQKPTISTEIHTSENWEEFWSAIKNTKYSYLDTLNNEQVKKRLVGAFEVEMEPYLRLHRKAIVALSLIKKDPYLQLKPISLVNHFNEAIANDDLKKAQMLQNILFGKLRSKEMDPSMLASMELPDQSKYQNLLYKKATLEYWNATKNLEDAYNAFIELERLDPSNGKIKYNRLA